ncbi:hypothetical protein POVWA2_050950 [Plasmodium ovale wallikeri]|uniref:Uncharacterized protein n=1 Tax=Plasmodium ovale wallikeri TaxID=864142 RepID=A0A1A8ZPZ1_PLAOA|nr:hypothetical protein POVWA2_050950 [Plasmodium ovale wallikeri]
MISPLRMHPFVKLIKKKGAMPLCLCFPLCRGAAEGAAEGAAKSFMRSRLPNRGSTFTALKHDLYFGRPVGKFQPRVFVNHVVDVRSAQGKRGHVSTRAFVCASTRSSACASACASTRSWRQATLTSDRCFSRKTSNFS